MKRDITKLFLNPNEMAFRKIYWPLLSSRKMTKVFRPGKRQSSDERGYRIGQTVVARVIDFIGADWAGIPPEFMKDLFVTIRIEQVETKRICDLLDDDFVGSSPDVCDQLSLRYHLGVIYNMFQDEIGDESLVSVISFSYPDMEDEKNRTEGTIESMVSRGIMSQATKPADNSHLYHLAPRYTMTLIEDDYPARSAAMWNAVYRTFGLDAVHVMFVAKTEDASEILQVFRHDPKYAGGGFGVGFKDEGIAYLDEVSPVARKIGAVNIVTKDADGNLVGHNTDGTGYAESLVEIFTSRGDRCKGKKVVMLGAGATGNAIAFSLVQREMRLVILNRTVEKAQMLARRINAHFHLDGEDAVRYGGEDDIAKEIKDADVIINVSTKGASGELERYLPLAAVFLPETKEALLRNHDDSRSMLRSVPTAAVISDVVLREGDTPLISMAKEMNFETLDGIPMVINQGVEAIWLVHGREFEGKGITKADIFHVMKRAAGF